MSEICCSGPGYATPLDAMKYGPREKLLYVVTLQPNLNEPHGDYLSTVDVDPSSSTYCKVIHRTYTNTTGNELHHSGWNTCSSCHKVKSSDKNRMPVRDKLILPGLNSNNIYVFDVLTDPRKPEIAKVIDGSVLLSENVSSPHTTHCLPNGNIMISTLGDRNDNAKGDFIVFDKDFNKIGTWTKPDSKLAICGYDYWYQPYFNIMAATEWGEPKLFKRGFNITDIDDPLRYGRRINFYDWTEQKLIQTIDLGTEGIAPLEVRFLHNPKENQGYFGSALFSKLFHFHKSPVTNQYVVQKVVDIPAKKVTGWILPELNGFMADILISLDDCYLYLINWFHGDVRQYDIRDRLNPKMVGQIFVGGIAVSDSGIIVTEDKELKNQPPPVYIKGRRLEGGPQMLQLSLDGKRLYVSSSLYSTWDKEFFPKMVAAGGTIIQIDVDNVNGGLTLNTDFLVDFGKEPYGPTLPHEMRYPGGDCTSDIWLACDEDGDCDDDNDDDKVEHNKHKEKRQHYYEYHHYHHHKHQHHYDDDKHHGEGKHRHHHHHAHHN